MDTSAIVAFFAGEAGGEQVLAWKGSCSLPFIALTELYAWAYRTHGKTRARELYALTLQWKRPVLYPNDRITLVAGEIKGEHGRLSLADSLIAATAMEYRLTLVTKDRGFRRLAPQLSLQLL